MSFQPPSKALTLRDYLFIGIAAALIIAVSTGLVFVNLSLPNGGGEFLRHWAGARAFVFERMDPYSTYVPAEVQSLVYDDVAGAGDEPYILDTPFHLLLLYLPFSLLTDPQTARAIYALILEWALFALAFLSLRLTEWTAPRWFAILFFLVCGLNFYSFQAILDASPVILLGAFYAGILYSLRRGQDELAGALIASSFYYWEVGLPFLAFVIWICYKQGRTRVFAGFGMLTIALLAVSFLLFPNWLIPYLRAGMNNLRTDFGFSILSVIRELLPASGIWLAWGVILLLGLTLGYEWNAALQGDERRFYWVACLILAVTPLLGFRTGLDALAVLFLPLALIFAAMYDRWKKIGSVLTFLFLLLLLLLPWALYLFAPPQIETISKETLFLFQPVFTVLGLYWIRWWALRPPRLWADMLARKS
jgi:hypothetical protein